MRTLSVVILSALSPLSLSAQTPRPLPTPAPRIARTPDTSGSAGASTQLPVTRVSLYKNGVGFFEHAGRVTGNQSITIDFTSAQLNDVLQSLTAVDLNGGRISGAAYNSTTPLDQQLKALPLALTEDPTSVDLYNAIRGARVEVTGSGAPITGRLLNIELVNTPTSDDTKPPTEKRLLTVMSESGSVRTLELTSSTNVRLLDPALQADVNRYLQLLANNRSQGLRHLTLQDNAPANGSGARQLRVSYISEVPVWKSTYRILFTDSLGPSTQQTATLQGWSVVDNTTGSDWLNVQLSLIAGSPQSFIQPLSQPIYSRRPEVAIAQEAQLTPQTFESGDELIPKDIRIAKEDGQPAPSVLHSPARISAGVGIGSGSGSAGGVMGGVGSASQIATANAAPMLPYEELATLSNAPQTTTNSFDDYFEYKITEPVTIRKNESALVPILQTKITSERVTLWSPQRTTPLRALWITNTSNLTLDRGSFSIVENGNFGGEGLLDPIHPNERRLLSYAADQAIRVTPANTNNTHTVQHLTVAKGVLTQRSLDINQVDYIVHNAAPDARTVIIEHPVRNGWTIDFTSSSSTPKPDETTSTAYRFRIEAASGKTATLHLRESHVGSQIIRLNNSINEDQLTVILRNADATPALLQQFEPVFAARRTLTDLDRQVQSKQNQINTITQDQNRLRENMKALKGSAEERALTTRYTTELNQQEDTLATLRKDLDTINQQHAAAVEDLSNKIQSLNFDADI